MNDPTRTTADLASARRGRAARAAAIGIATFACGAILLFSPAVLGHGMPSACLAGVGFFIGCVGVSILLHSAWDWLMGK